MKVRGLGCPIVGRAVTHGLCPKRRQGAACHRLCSAILTGSLTYRAQHLALVDIPKAREYRLPRYLRHEHDKQIGFMYHKAVQVLRVALGEFLSKYYPARLGLYLRDLGSVPWRVSMHMIVSRR